MNNFNSLLQILTFLALPALAYLIFLLKAGTEAAVRTSAEEAAKAAIQELRWPGELARELQKARGVERQESRYKSYAALWKCLRPLAIYETLVIDKKAASELSKVLSDWYFCESGGLLLTPQARGFYFALQDLLRTISGTAYSWVVERPTTHGNEPTILLALLEDRRAGTSIEAFHFVTTGSLEDWKKDAADYATKWRSGINVLADDWQHLDNDQRFATLQQAGSILRSSLANDLESRLL
ncbi:MAG: hypothetical protein U1E53_23455 [Dongiaceae bacterium]